MSRAIQGGKVIDCSDIVQLVVMSDGTEKYDIHCTRKQCPCPQFLGRLRKR